MSNRTSPSLTTSRIIRSRAARTSAIATVLAGTVALAGCASSGLSTRENLNGGGYSDYALAMYDAPADGAASPTSGQQAPANPVAFPARLAVAQLGEVAPPEPMMKALRERDDLYASVQTVPGAASFSNAPIRTGPGPQDWREADIHEQARQHLNAMRRYSRDIGAQYLFVFGGTADYGTKGTALSAADLTIIGAFIVPGKKTEAQLQASGTLIDVESGRVMLSVSAGESGTKRSTAIQSEAAEARLLVQLREKVTIELADSLGTEFQSRAAAPAQGG